MTIRILSHRVRLFLIAPQGLPFPSSWLICLWVKQHRTSTRRVQAGGGAMPKENPPKLRVPADSIKTGVQVRGGSWRAAARMEPTDPGVDEERRRARGRPSPSLLPSPHRRSSFLTRLCVSGCAAGPRVNAAIPIGFHSQQWARLHVASFLFQMVLAW